MRPTKFIETHLDWHCWTIGFGIDFRFRSAFITVGPAGVQLNWNAR